MIRAAVVGAAQNDRLRELLRVAEEVRATEENASFTAFANAFFADLLLEDAQ